MIVLLYSSFEILSLVSDGIAYASLPRKQCQYNNEVCTLIMKR